MMRYLILIIVIIPFLWGCGSGSQQDISDNEVSDDFFPDDEVNDDLVNDEDVGTPDKEFIIIEDEFDCTEDDMFWIYDLSQMPPKDIQICAHVRSESDNIRVLVSDEVWQKSLKSEDILKILEAWEVNTLVDSRNGIFQTVTDLFGAVPNEFNTFPGLYLFLYEMESYGGNSFDGYFRIDDQYDRNTSNKREMIHINVASKNPADNYSLSVQAHEFQHLIHWGHDSYEEMWLNEAMSELAMVVTGFGADEDWVKSWLNNPKDSLMAEGPSYNYGVLLLFGTYLYDLFGPDFISELVADKRRGADSIENVVKELKGLELSFDDLGADFALAAMVNDNSYDDGRYGFESDVLPVKLRSRKITSDQTVVTASGKGGMVFLRIEDYQPENKVSLLLEGAENVYGRAAIIENGTIKSVAPFNFKDSFDIEENAGELYVAIFNSSNEEAVITIKKSE
jgi:hypothetical protein